MVDSNSTIEQQEEALDDLKKMGFDPANEGIEEFIENQKKLVIVQAGIKAIEKELEGIYQERLELFSKFKDEQIYFFLLIFFYPFGINCGANLYQFFRLTSRSY